VLDYGGQEGYNLASFAQTGNSCFVLDYLRFDHPDGISYLGRDTGDLLAQDRFDVILVCHTLEHLVNPVELLSDLGSRLTDGGAMYVEVPLGCWREYRSISDPITHVNFFSEQSLAGCLSRAGLRTVKLSTDYQWVTHARNWCVNAVGRRGNGPALAPASTSSQMRAIRYYAVSAAWKALGKISGGRL